MKQSYFLGCASPAGFKSEFISQIQKQEYYTYILKGGPGTGKSTLMKKIANACDDDKCELYYCSSDTKSLDAVVLTDKKIIVVDGTAPHVYDPLLPGVSQEVVNLGAFWNQNDLSEHKDLIRYYFDENASYHTRAKRCIQAVASLNANIYNTAASAIIKDKLDSFVSRLSNKLFSRPSTVKKAAKEFKQISALTSYGYLTQDIPESYTVYTLKDDYFAGSDYFLRALADIAVEHGIDVIVSKCYMLNESTYEHVLIPKLNIAFITSNFLNGCKIENRAIINFSRFYDKSIISNKKASISFDKKAVSEIFDEASTAVDTALDIHDEIEKFYINSLNIELLNTFSNDFINKITE